MAAPIPCPRRLGLLAAGLLAGLAVAAPAEEAPAVLRTRVDLRPLAGGILSTVTVDTYARRVPSAPLPAVSGGGKVLGVEPSKGRFRVVPPEDSRPEAQTVVQESRGHGQLRVLLWSPLDPLHTDLFLRLPPCPSGTWSYRGAEGGPRKLPTSNGGATRAVDGGVEGEVPADGRLRVGFGEPLATGARDLLAEARLLVRLTPEGARFEAVLRGYTRRPHQPVGLPEALLLEPGDVPHGARAPRVREVGERLELVVPGASARRGRWYEVVLAGRVDTSALPLRVGPPFLVDAAAPRRAAIRVVPELPRRFDLSPPSGWDEADLPRGAREVTAVTPDGPMLARLRLFGEVLPAPGVARVGRIDVRSVPAAEGGARTLRTSVTYRVVSPGRLRLRAPAGMELPRRGVAGSTRPEIVRVEGKEDTYEVDFDRAQNLQLEVEHVLPVEEGSVFEAALAVPRPEGDAVEVLTWSGRLPRDVAFLSEAGEDVSWWRRLPYPMRWMRAAFDGLGSVLTEAGTPLMLAAAGLLAAYAYLFMVPPNRQTAYVLSACLAAMAVLQVLFSAAQPRPPTAERPGTGPPPSMPLFRRMQEAMSRLPRVFHEIEGEGGVPEGVPPPGMAEAELLARRRQAEEMWARAHAHPADSRLEALDPRMRGRDPLAEERPAARGEARGLNAEQDPADDPEAQLEDDFEFRVAGATPEIRLRLVGRGLLPVVGVLLALASLAVLAACRLFPGPAAPAGAALLAVALIPFDLLFPADAQVATMVLLLAAVAATLQRVSVVGAATWERIQAELEARRVRELRRGGFPGGAPEDGVARGPLKKNEVTYEEVFRDEMPEEEEPADDGEITFLVGGDAPADGDEGGGDEAGASEEPGDGERP